MRAVSVAVADVFGQDGMRMPSVVDQESVSALGAGGAHEPFGAAIRPPRLRRCPDDVHAPAAEHLAERRRELGIPISDEETERTDPLSEAHGQIAGCLRDPATGWTGCDTEQMHSAGADLHHEQDVHSRRRKIVSIWKKSQANSPAACVRRKVRHEVFASRGTGPIRWARKIRRTVASPTR